MDILEQLREFIAPLFRSFWFYFGIAMLITKVCDQMNGNVEIQNRRNLRERIFGSKEPKY